MKWGLGGRKPPPIPDGPKVFEKCIWRPQPDITAYELAYAMGRAEQFGGGLPRIGGVYYVHDEIDPELPPGIIRHYERTGERFSMREVIKIWDDELRASL